MAHLSLEELARILDEEPSRTELEHLQECDSCQQELAALQADREALGELPDLLAPPADAWTAIAERLRAEGLMQSSETTTTAGRALHIRGSQGGPARVRRDVGFLRLVAALALFIMGGASGYLLGSGDRLDLATDHPGRAGRPLPVGADTTGEDRPMNHQSAAAALALREAEAGYQLALTRYISESLREDPSADPLARLADLAEEWDDPERAADDRQGLAPLRVDTLRIRETIARFRGEQGALRTEIPLVTGETSGAGPTHDSASRLRTIAGVSIGTLDPDLARYFPNTAEGVLVLHVDPGSAGAASGLVPGDVVTRVAGTPVRTAGAFQAAVERGAGEVIDMEIIRRGERLELRFRP